MFQFSINYSWVRDCSQLVVTRDYFYRLHLHHRPVNDLSTAVKLTNRLLRFWANGGFVFYKRVRSPSFLVWGPIPYNITSWFAIALAEIRTSGFLREKAECKQQFVSLLDYITLVSKINYSSRSAFLISILCIFCVWH